MSIPKKIQAAAELQKNLQVQAKLRLTLGFSIAILILLFSRLDDSMLIAPDLRALLYLLFLYLGYNFLTLYLSNVTWPSPPKQVIYGTALLDPLWLTAGLALLHQESQLFIGFYLFTILGYGFRFGVRPMWASVCASMFGLSILYSFAPAWYSRLLIVSANFILLLVVPLYSTWLLKELHAARRRAEHESQAKSRLLANVSHDMRTPLSGIVACAYLIREDSPGSQNRARAETILRLAANLKTEIDNLLDSAKYEAAALKFNTTHFRLQDLMEQVRATLAPAAAAKGIAFEVHTDERIRDMVAGDPYYLGRVLMNIGGNAVKFTESGKVGFDILLLGDEGDACLLRFSCRDTGIGIPFHLHEKIFERFFQAPGSHPGSYGGTGLGMSIAREIVSMMGGQIRVESTPGRGSLFYFDLRLEKVSQPAPDGESAPLHVVHGKHILVADDHRTNLMILKAMLERDRHTVKTASSGEEAIRLMKSESFDLIFLDLNMGDLNGITVLGLYRFGKTEAAPVYFFTADTSPEMAEYLKNCGAIGVLHKPISSDELRQAIAAAFEPYDAMPSAAESANPSWPGQGGPVPG